MSLTMERRIRIEVLSTHSNLSVHGLLIAIATLYKGTTLLLGIVILVTTSQTLRVTVLNISKCVTYQKVRRFRRDPL